MSGMRTLPGVRSLGNFIYNNWLPTTLDQLRGRLCGSKIFANSIPKAGTNLLQRTLSLFPELIHRGLALEKSFEHDSIEFKRLKPGQFAVGHIGWSPSWRGYMADNNIRMFLMIRDPRDIAVSTVNYVTRMDEGHRLRAYLQSLPDDAARLSALLTGVPGPSIGPGQSDAAPLGEALRAFVPWTHEPGCLVVRYEDLVGPQGGGSADRQLETVRAISEHIGIQASPERIRHIAENSYWRKSRTFHKGTTGRWREVFTPEHVATFKATSGNLLEILGYEHNDAWDAQSPSPADSESPEPVTS